MQKEYGKTKGYLKQWITIQGAEDMRKAHWKMGQHPNTFYACVSKAEFPRKEYSPERKNNEWN